MQAKGGDVMNIILKHKIAFIALIIAIACLAVTLWVTRGKSSNGTEVIDNSFLDNSSIREVELL